MAWGKDRHKVQIDVDQDEVDKTLKKINETLERIEKATERAEATVKLVNEAAAKASLKIQEMKQMEDRLKKAATKAAQRPGRSW